jgi:hypothetical protein
MSVDAIADIYEAFVLGGLTQGDLMDAEPIGRPAMPHAR